MPKPFETWQVLPHGKVSQVDDVVLTVVGHISMPVDEFPRRMTVARLRDRRPVANIRHEHPLRSASALPACAASGTPPLLPPVSIQGARHA